MIETIYKQQYCQTEKFHYKIEENCKCNACGSNLSYYHKRFCNSQIDNNVTTNDITWKYRNKNQLPKKIILLRKSVHCGCENSISKSSPNQQWLELFLTFYDFFSETFSFFQRVLSKFLEVSKNDNPFGISKGSSCAFFGTVRFLNFMSWNWI